MHKNKGKTGDARQLSYAKPNKQQQEQRWKWILLCPGQINTLRAGFFWHKTYIFDVEAASTRHHLLLEPMLL